MNKCDWFNTLVDTLFIVAIVLFIAAFYKHHFGNELDAIYSMCVAIFCLLLANWFSPR